jgi:hypothetical protein
MRESATKPPPQDWASMGALEQLWGAASRHGEVAAVPPSSGGCSLEALWMAGRARWEAEAKWVVDASVNAELEQAGIVLESREPATPARAAPAPTAPRPASAPVSAPGSPSSPPQRGRPDNVVADAWLSNAWQTAVGVGDEANTPPSTPLLKDVYGTLGRLELLATAEEPAQNEARLARLDAELNDRAAPRQASRQPAVGTETKTGSRQWPAAGGPTFAGE